MVHEADQLGVAVHELSNLRLVLAGVLAQWEGDVVVEVHGPEQGTVLEEDAELLAHFVEALFAEADDLVAVDPDLAALGDEQAEDVLEQHGLSGARGTQDGGDPALGHVEGDVLEHRVGAEGLRDPSQRDDRLSRCDPRLRSLGVGPEDRAQSGLGVLRVGEGVGDLQLGYPYEQNLCPARVCVHVVVGPPERSAAAEQAGHDVTQPPSRPPGAVVVVDVAVLVVPDGAGRGRPGDAAEKACRPR